MMADADVDVAAKDAVDFSLANCGQVCCAVERVYVADEIYPAFEAKVVEHAKSYVFGNGLDPASQMGPLVSDTQRQIVHQHVQAATKAGAKVSWAAVAAVGRQGHLLPANGTVGRPPRRQGDHSGGDVWPGGRALEV